MLKQVVGLTVLLFHLGAFAQELTCLDKLLPFSRHSGLHQLTREEWSDGKESLDSISAKSALQSLVMNKLFCRQGEVVIKIEPVCEPLLADTPQSNVCFLFANLGYFVFSKDNGKNVNIVFSKDKRFNDPTP